MRIDLVNGTGQTMYEQDRGFRIVDPPYYAFNIDGWTSTSNVFLFSTLSLYLPNTIHYMTFYRIPVLNASSQHYENKPIQIY